MLLEKQLTESELILKNALDKLIYVWTYDTLERRRCPKVWLTTCRLYLLICGHLSHERCSSVFKNEDQRDKERVNRLIRFSVSNKEINILNEVINKSDQIGKLMKELIDVRNSKKLISPEKT